MIWAPTTLGPDDLGDDEDTRFEDAPPWGVRERGGPARQAPAPRRAQATPAPIPTPVRVSPNLDVPSLVRPSPLPQAAQVIAPLPAPVALPQPAHAVSLPMPPMHVGDPGRHYSYAEALAKQQQQQRAELATYTFPKEIPAWQRIAMPVAGVVALAVFASTYFAFSSSSSSKSPAIVTQSNAIVAAAAAPSITSELPTDSHWKARTIEPTIAPPPTPEPVVAPQVEEPAEIEMPASPAERTSRRASKRTARIAAAAPRGEEVRPAKRERAGADPVLAEIAKPAGKLAETPKKRGPGKLEVSSNVPALIYIDGRSTKLMTPKTINLPPGPHTITLLDPSTRQAKTGNVTIASGTTVELSKAFSSGRTKSRVVKVDTSSPLGNLRPGKVVK